jgi:molybdopterin/thiamine biosynthesis adenylyltransferase
VLYTVEDIGRPKVAAAADRLARVNPHVRITTAPAKVSGPAGARAVIEGRDLLVCAADRPRLLLYDWLNEAALAERVPWVRAGNAGLTISAFLHVPYETACFDCVQRTAAEEFPWFDTMNRYILEQLHDTAMNPCIAPVAGLLGSIVAMEVTKYLTEATPSALVNRRMILDLARMELVYVDGRRREDCPACGHAPAILEEAGAWGSS